MTNDDIIRMAREAKAGMLHGGEYSLMGNAAIERFAALVAAAERRACAELCDTIGGEFKEDMAEHTEDKYWERMFGAEECAEAIRARGQE